MCSAWHNWTLILTEAPWYDWNIVKYTQHGGGICLVTAVHAQLEALLLSKVSLSFSSLHGDTPLDRSTGQREPRAVKYLGLLPGVMNGQGRASAGLRVWRNRVFGPLYPSAHGRTLLGGGPASCLGTTGHC